jgi:5-methylcytosine-specific restriction endonuclease McrA
VCGDEATDVDHIVPVTDDHSLMNLQSLCTDCHRTKTAWEGNWAQGRGLDKGPEWIRQGRTDLLPMSIYGYPERPF